MSSTAQARAIKNYRKRLSKRGMARFEVLGLESDRELIRTVARRLAENSSESEEIRGLLQQRVSFEARRKGGVLAALRSWPLGELNLTRPYTEGRRIDV
jgi:hypothetical protein